MEDWQRLGLEAPSQDSAEIKRAYAKRLRVTRPDDDPQAYQALREAYDRLLADARRPTREIAPTESPTAATVPEPIPPAPVEEAPQPEPPPRGWLPPAALCVLFTEAFQAGGDTAALTRLPELMHELHALPLQAQDEASVRFADAVIAHRDLPVGVLVAWRDHFGWLGDYRVARLLGPGRAAALAYVLQDLVAPETDPDVLQHFADVMHVDRLIKRGPRWLAQLIATLTDEVVRRQLAHVHALTYQALHGQLGLPGRRLLAALQMQPSDQNQVASALGFSRTVRMVLLVCVIAFALPFDVMDRVLAFLCSGLIIGAGALGVAKVTWLIVQATDWRRRRLAAKPKRVEGRSTPIETWGLLLMVAGAVVLSAEPTLRLPGQFAVGLGLAGLGAALMVPEDVPGTLAGLGGLGYLAFVAHGLHWADAILLAAWMFNGIPLLSDGRFRQLTTGGLTLRRVFAIAIAVIPVAAAWLASRWGHRLVLWCTLVAAVAQLHLAPIPVPWWARLILQTACLAICLAAGICARAGATATGRWLAAHFP